MPLRNRVTPLGELVADPARGLVYGNRGCLHDERRPHPPALRRQALDRMPARVPRLAARAAAAARPLHRALLPRRGDGVRRRAPAVRALPARGLRPLLGALARAPSRRRSAPTRSTRGCTPSASIPRPRRSGATTRGSPSCPTAPSCCTTASLARARRECSPLDARRATTARAATGDGPGRAADAAVARRASCAPAGTRSCRCCIPSARCRQAASSRRPRSVRWRRRTRTRAPEALGQ